MQSSEEIKSRLDIVEVIREYIQVKAAGTSFRALCPFHHEKTPSFMISPEKQIWHCFGCGKGGDIFSFVMEMEGMEFSEALRTLANKAGVVLKKEDPRFASERHRVLEALDLSAKYYHKMLLETAEAEGARKYLAKRGLAGEIIDEWRIGYSPDKWDSLLNFLKGKGYRENEIFAAGLSVKKEGANSFYDRFRGRIMFPISDVNGNITAFSARVLPAQAGRPEKEATEKMGKYINSPQTIVYDKSKILFGLDKAKSEIKKKDQAIIVEGQMDAITAHSHGFKNVVASSGTALTGDQIKLIKRYSNNLFFALDSDLAGQNATDRGGKVVRDVNYPKEVEAEDRYGRVKTYIQPALSEDVKTAIIQLPSGKDPDECIKNNPAEWEEAIKNAKPFMQYYFDKTFAALDIAVIDDKRKAAKILLPVLARIGNKIEQDYWLKKLSQALDVKETLLRETLDGLTKKERPVAGTKSEAKTEQMKNPREEKLSELFLALLFKFPLIIEYAINHISPDQIAGLANSFLYKNLIIYYNNFIDSRNGEESQESELDYENFRNWLVGLPKEGKERDSKAGGLKLLDMLALLGDKDFYEYEYEQAKSEAIKITAELKKYYLTGRMKEIEKLIAQAEIRGDKEEAKILMEEFKIATDEMKEFF